MSPLATLLEDQAEALLHRWVERVREGVAPGARSEPELRDHIPLFLGELARALHCGQAPARSHAAEAHGRQRYRIGFDIEMLIREYGELRKVILDAVEEHGVVVTLGEVRVLTDFISNAIAEGVTEHAGQTRLAEQALTAAHLQALGEREARLATTLSSIGDAVITTDAAGRVVFLNPVAEALTGWGQGEALRRSITEVFHVVHESTRAPVGSPVERVLREGARVRLDQPAVLLRQDGHEIPIADSAAPICDDQGGLIGVVLVFRDTSDKKRAEAERETLLAREQAARTQVVEVLESINDPFFALDASWRFTLVNQQYEHTSRKGRDEVLGRLFWDLFPAAASSRYLQGYQRCMTARERVHFVDHDATLDLWTDVRAYPTADGGIAVFLRDISVERQAEEALKRQADFEKQLLGIVSHDLRNPLNAILLGAGALTASEELDSRSLRIATRIRSSAERAGRMIRDLLDFTQARLGGGIRLEPRPTNLHELVRAVMDEIGATFPDRRVQVREEGDGQGQWDPDRLAQVVQNLVTNALKYSPPDSTVQVVTEGEEAGISFCVHNRGAPIPADKLPRLFEPFQRAEGRVDMVSRSVGLGLYIVKEVVAAHHGTVEVESSPDQGTTFRVRLPRTPPPARAS